MRPDIKRNRPGIGEWNDIRKKDESIRNQREEKKNKSAERRERAERVLTTLQIQHGQYTVSSNSVAEQQQLDARMQEKAERQIREGEERLRELQSEQKQERQQLASYKQRMPTYDSDDGLFDDIMVEPRRSKRARRATDWFF